MRNGEFYDLTVPVFEHYLSDGIYHHNSGKTKAGIYRATLLSMQPNNLGIVGRAAETRLKLTTQRDFLGFLYDAKLLKSKPTKEHGALVYCVDPKTNKPLGYTSEILFDHMEDPDHLHGHHTGWFWIDEASECPQASWLKLIGRNRLNTVQFRSGFVTGNPEGHNWIYDFWFNPQKVQDLTDAQRLMRRGIHATSYENYYLDAQYIDDMRATYPEEWLKRYLLGDMDVFEGQIFKEFSHDVHCVDSRQCKGFKDGQPPEDWAGYLGIDPGGTNAWGLEFAAIDPWGNIVFYDEISQPGEYTDEIALKAKPKLGRRKFSSIVIDWENRQVSAELRRHGINVRNAQKRGKIDSVTIFGGYLHPNKKVPYPNWHPYAGTLGPNGQGSPRVFFTEGVPVLTKEVPQQRWKEVGDIAVNELEKSIVKNSFDAALYIMRERPRPEDLPRPTFREQAEAMKLDKRSAAYYLMELAAQERQYKQNRQGFDKVHLPFRKGMPTPRASA